MNVFGNLFKNNKVECPRCLGKGEVDEADIKRLKMELKWIPGSCAYCQGKGNVSEKMISDIDVNSNYLTANISERERKRIINKDEGALKRAEHRDFRIDRQIKAILYLYQIGKLSPQKILDFFFLDVEESINIEDEKKEFLAYINRVIKYSN